MGHHVTFVGKKSEKVEHSIVNLRFNLVLQKDSN